MLNVTVAARTDSSQVKKKSKNAQVSCLFIAHSLHEEVFAVSLYAVRSKVYRLWARIHAYWYCKDKETPDAARPSELVVRHETGKSPYLY
jgi:general stress protein 26